MVSLGFNIPECKSQPCEEIALYSIGWCDYSSGLFKSLRHRDDPREETPAGLSDCPTFCPPAGDYRQTMEMKNLISCFQHSGHRNNNYEVPLARVRSTPVLDFPPRRRRPQPSLVQDTRGFDSARVKFEDFLPIDEASQTEPLDGVSSQDCIFHLNRDCASPKIRTPYKLF
jgi:hypothetical protein